MMKRIYEAPASELINITSASILGVSVTGDTPGTPIPWGGEAGDEQPESNVAHWDELMDKYYY